MSSILSCFILVSCDYVFKYISYILLWYSVSFGDWLNTLATVDGTFDVFDSWVHIILESKQSAHVLRIFFLQVRYTLVASKILFLGILPTLHF